MVRAVSVLVLLSLLVPNAPRLSGGEAALRFEGAQTLSVPPLPLGPHTVEMWIRPEGPLPPGSAPGAVFDWGGRVGLFVSTIGLDYLVNADGQGAVRLTAPPLPENEWHHVAVVYDGSRMRILLDGKLLGARAVPGATTLDPQALMFGAPQALLPSSLPYFGALDEIRVWDRARSEDEVEEWMNDHLAPGGGPLGYWDLDEGAGPIAADRAGARDAVLGDTREVDPSDPLWTPSVAPVRKPDPGLTFGFDPPGPLPAGAGEVFRVNCTLTAAAGAAPGGVTAWSISVRHDRQHLILEDATLDGTAADGRAADGFAALEFLDDGTRAGFASRVVLSESGGKALPPVGIFALARTSYRGVVNLALAAEAWIRYDDRLPAGTQVTPESVVKVGAATRRPFESRLAVSLEAPRFALTLEPAKATAPPGGKVDVACMLATSGNHADSGPSAWSLSVMHDPGILELLDATTTGTALDPFAGQGIFVLTEKVNNATGTGFISVAILNISEPNALPAEGKEVVARARYRVIDGVALETRTTVAFTDGLRGSGVPVENLVNFTGGSQRPERAELALRVGRAEFLRGDSNGDRRVNLSDAVVTLNSLFLGREPLRCADAGDANDDGHLNIADPVYVLRYLFQGGALPSAPFPDVGDDPSPDALDCAEYP